MCLYNAKKIENRRYETKCYKVFKRAVHHEEDLPYSEQLMSPCYDGERWDVGEMKKIPGSPWFKPDADYLDGKVKGDAYHVFKDVEGTEVFVMMYQLYLDHKYEYVVCECTIPEDSEYVYEGTVYFRGSVRADGYATQKLRVDKIIKVYERES